MLVRLYITVLALSSTAACVPVSSVFSTFSDTPDNPVISTLQPRKVHSAVQTGLIASLATAGIAGLGIGLAEYIASLNDRLIRQGIEIDRNVKDVSFDRAMRRVQDDGQNTGLDILLDLIERYMDINRTKDEEIGGVARGDPKQGNSNS